MTSIDKENPDQKTIDSDATLRLALLELVVDSIDQGFSVWDDDDRLIVCNRQFMEIWGYPEKLSLPGTPMIELLAFHLKHVPANSDWDDATILAEAEARRVYVKQNRVPGQGERYTHYNGTEIFIRRYSVAGLGHMATFSDISSLRDAEAELHQTQSRLQDQVDQLERREAELDLARSELLALNNDKDRLFSILAHDLLGPFNAIIGFSGLLKMRAEHLNPEKIVEAADAINESATGLHQLLASLLEWSKAQMDGASVNFQLIDVDQIVSAVRELFLASARQKNIRIVGEILPVKATTDADMLAAIVRNLVSNAVKFTPSEGEISLNLESDNQWVNIRVADTGVGLTVEQLDRVFSAEGLSSSSGTMGEPGTGLGLQVCKDFVGQLGGEIRTESRSAGGTSICVSIPLDPPKQM
jgi:signal transduction histidine kinase